MMHIAWCCLEEVPYCFSRSSVKFQGHTALKIVEFDPNWAFPDCNLNSPMATKFLRIFFRIFQLCTWEIPVCAITSVNFHGSFWNVARTFKFGTKVGLKMLININSVYFHNRQKKILAHFFPIWQFCTRKITVSALKSVNFHGSLPEASIGLRVLSLPASVRPSVCPSPSLSPG